MHVFENGLKLDEVSIRCMIDNSKMDADNNRYYKCKNLVFFDERYRRKKALTLIKTV